MMFKISQNKIQEDNKSFKSNLWSW